MAVLFFIPVKPKVVNDTHHFVDDDALNYAEDPEFENRTEDYEHETLQIDEYQEQQLIELEN